jgi:hypothetical protein
MKPAVKLRPWRLIGVDVRSFIGEAEYEIGQQFPALCKVVVPNIFVFGTSHIMAGWC